MPTINLPPKKPKKERRVTDIKKLRSVAYNSSAWRKLRLTYLKEHPLCEECLKKGKVTPASSVHHIKSPFKGGEINWDLLLDYNNLESVDHECHALLHQEESGYKSPEKTIKELDELLGYKPTASDFIEVLEEFFDED